MWPHDGNEERFPDVSHPSGWEAEIESTVAEDFG
jgi:hypothetical protein